MLRLLIAILSISCVACGTAEESKKEEQKSIDVTTVSGKYSQVWPGYVTSCDNGEVVNQAGQSVNREVLVIGNEIKITNAASAIGNDNTSMPGVEIKSVIPYGGLIQNDGSFSATQKVEAVASGSELIMTYTMVGVISKGRWEGSIFLSYVTKGIICQQEIKFTGDKLD